MSLLGAVDFIKAAERELKAARQKRKGKGADLTNLTIAAELKRLERSRTALDAIRKVLIGQDKE